MHTPFAPLIPCSKVMVGEGEEEGLFDRCNGTPAFLAPEMMKPHARYRCGSAFCWRHL